MEIVPKELKVQYRISYISQTFPCYVYAFPSQSITNFPILGKAAMTAAIFHAGGSAAPASAAAAALSMLPWGQLSRSRRHATSTPPLPGNGTRTTPQKTAGKPAWTKNQKCSKTPAHYHVPPPLQATPALHCPAVA